MIIFGDQRDIRSPKDRAKERAWLTRARKAQTERLLSKSVAFDTALEVKTVGDALTFSGYSSTWAGPDSQGDAIEPGAFRDTIKAWKGSGEKLPLLDQHRYDSVRSVVGYALELAEDRKGLWSRWRLLDTRDGEEAYARIEAKVITGLSIGYYAESRPPTPAERAKDIRRVLTRISLREVSLVIWPANEEARISGKRPYIELERASAGGFGAYDTYSRIDAFRVRRTLSQMRAQLDEQRRRWA